MTSTKLPAESNSLWPYGTILFYGTFGKTSAAGRRYHQRAGLALLLLVIIQAAGAWVPREYHSWFWPTTGLAFTYISWEWWRYVISLDELERRLQLEAAAWTYIAGMAVAMTLAGLHAVLGWRIFPGWLLLLEPLRAWRLYKLTRRFE